MLRFWEHQVETALDAVVEEVMAALSATATLATRRPACSLDEAGSCPCGVSINYGSGQLLDDVAEDRSQL